MLKFVYNFIFLTLTSSICYAEDSCIDCARRKLKLCAEECALVPETRTNDCQKLCITQYCSHRCKTDTSISEIDSLFKLDCEECKEQQFPLCNSNCDIKSEYKKALCQVDCSIKRCLEKCK